jgi:hypothetical protein
MSERTDIHRPSVIEPDDYEFVAFEYLGSRVDPATILGEREVIRAHMARTGDTYSRHAHGGSCHICGASASYTALFYHAKSRSYIRTGLDCADKLDCGDAEMFRTKIERAIEAYAGKRKAIAILEKEGLSKAWTVYTTPRPYEEPTTYEVRTIEDMVGKLVKYGSMSEKAMSYLRVLVDKVDRAVEIAAERVAKRAAEHEAAAPVPTEGARMLVRGTILSFKEGMFGMRMLVKTEAGYKLFGARPSAVADAVKGDEVEFYAVVSPSKDDPKFGFFSRPTKARITSAPEAEDVMADLKGGEDARMTLGDYARAADRMGFATAYSEG